jgi:putative nucleotidyltransferase with HDIG domain
MTSKKRIAEKKSMPPLKKRLRSLKKTFAQSLEDMGNRIAYPATLLTAALLIFALIRPPAVEDLSDFHLGGLSPRIINSSIEFDYINKIATEGKKNSEEALVSPVYRIRTQQENLNQRISAIISAAREIPRPEGMEVETWAQSVCETANVKLRDRAYEFSETDFEKVPRTTYQSLFFYKDYEAFLSSVQTHIQTAAGRGVADDVAPLRVMQANSDKAANSPITIGVTLIDENENEMVFPKPDEIKSEAVFFQRFEQLITSSFPKTEDLAARQLSLDLIQAIYEGPSLLYDKNLTEARRKERRDLVEPIKGHVNKGETIVGKNMIVTQEIMAKLEAYQERMKLSPLVECGYLVLVLFFVLILMRFLQIYNAEIVEDTRKTAVIFIAVIMILFLARICAQLALLDLGSNTLKQVGFGVPMGALGVILTILAGARLAAFTCMITSVYMGIILHRGMELLSLSYILVAMFTACVAIFAVTRIRQRSDLYRAGGIVMILACGMILALAMPQYKTLEQLIDHVDELKYALIWGGVNGLLVSIFSIALLPLFEDLFGVTTDIKLLELGQKNELLQRLEQEAPGSYQHTMRVATLAESAAEAIGANALLARVGCYYHDIGKMVKPQYFVENQQTSADKAKHSKLSPNMSCLIIRNHVKYGLELAKEYNLPKVIRDFIPEHHGTTLMTYFYHEALENQETEGTVKEEDFRYPGPKPQSKETAILMLADSIEAASRTLETGSEREVRQLVRKLINEKFMDEQFDECNLTLKDLHTLFHSFSDSIIHMLHQRIVYPSAPASKEKEEERENDKGETKARVKPVAFKEKKEGEKSKPKSEPGMAKESA